MHNQKLKYIEYLHPDQMNMEFDKNYGQAFLTSSKFKELSPKTLLDAGCGNGQFGVNAVKDYNVEKVYSVDFASVCCGKIITNYPNIVYIDADIKKIPLPNKIVDYVTCFDVLEHLLPENINDTFQEFRRLAKKGIITKISYTKAGKSSPTTGENYHMTIKPKEWWISKINEYFEEVEIYKQYILGYIKD